MYVPHDEDDKLHNDLIENLKELDHQLASLPHLAEEDGETHTETDQACNIHTFIIKLSSRIIMMMVNS